jgi:hypothetical protein
MTAAETLHLVSIDDYLTLPSLAAYLLIEPDRPLVVVHRRAPAGGFTAQVYGGPDAVIPFDDVGCSLPLADLYDRVDFTAAAAAAAARE